MSQRVKKKASPMARQEAVAGYVFILPTILLYLCLTIIPIIVTFSLSFMDYDLSSLQPLSALTITSSCFRTAGWGRWP